MTIAKAITSGYFPLGATLIGETMAEVFESDTSGTASIGHGYTYSGHPVGCAAGIAAWDKSLAEFEALKPEIVVAGHAKPGLPNDASGLSFSRKYIAAWPGLVAGSKDSKDLQAKVRTAFPDAIDILDGFLLVNSTEVAKGEQPRWTE